MNIWAFVDGTFKGIARPTEEQKIYYSGHKKEHGIKWQGIITPDGIISLQGPYEGKANDWSMYHDTKVERRMRKVWSSSNYSLVSFLLTASQICHNHPTLYLYGDPAYYASFGCIGPYRRASGLSHDQARFNKMMSSIRIAVEHGFGLTQKQWSHAAWSLANKEGLSPITAYYLVGVLLTTCFTCMRGNQVADNFLLSPPTLDDYLQIDEAENNDFYQLEAGMLVQNGEMAGQM